MRKLFRVLLLFLSFKSISQQKDEYQIVNIGIDFDGKIIPCGDNIERHLRKEFYIGKHPFKYAIDIKENAEAILYEFKNREHWVVKDTLNSYTNIENLNANCEILCPSIEITDFNKDGFDDLLYWSHTNVNGNRWMIIYLYNTDKKELELLYNSAEDSTIWSAPEYNKKKKRIECTELSSVFGITYRSSYRLEHYQAIPLQKEEYDTTELNREIYRKYTGENGKWKKVKENVKK